MKEVLKIAAFVNVVSFCSTLGREVAVKTQYLFNADGAVIT